jgi:hypothetical protein
VDHEQIDPLGGIQLIWPVFSDTVLDKPVGELEDLLQKHVLMNHIELEHVLLEGVVENITKNFEDLHVFHEALDTWLDGGT